MTLAPQLPFCPDPRQKEAIEHVHGPMLVLAGAGTGKTTVLTGRIAYLLKEGHARPDEILGITYTENAAEEMRRKLREGWGVGEQILAKLRISTFHSYSYGVLERAGQAFGVLDEQDMWIYLRRRIGELGLERFIKAANLGEFLGDLWQFFGRCHDELRTPEDFQRFVDDAIAGKYPLPRVVRSNDLATTLREEIVARCRELARVYRKVESMLAEDGLGTFGHQITRAVTLLRSDPDRLRHEEPHARFILIDEFQDANLAQIELVHLLAGDDGNVFAVGDPDQAIYRFRGATAGAFEQFLSRFPSTKAVSLIENQRSTSPILRTAFSAISQNPAVVQGREGMLDFVRNLLVSAREERARRAGHPLHPAPVAVVMAAPQSQERSKRPVPTSIVQAAEVAECIRDLHDQEGVRWSDCAVLYRLTSHRDALVEEFASRGVPFVVKGLNVLDVPEVRDILAALRALVVPSDSISLLRLSALPQFHVDARELRRRLRTSDGGTTVEVLRGFSGGREVLRVLQQASEYAARKTWKLLPVLSHIVGQLGFDCESPPIAALLAFAQTWSEKPITTTGQVAEFLEYLDYFVEARGSVALPLEGQGGLDAVQFMTVHGAKGLEFPYVFVVRANTSSFPYSYREPLFEFPPELRDKRGIDAADGKQAHDAEERRLFYVAMTRARDVLTLCAKPGGGKTDPTPAGFLRELMKDKNVADVLASRPARPYRVALAAAAAPAMSPVAEWMCLPPEGDLSSKPLSASAIETYRTCPLKFKIQRDWQLPEEPVAAMQFGSVMHAVLRNFFEAYRAGRELTDDALIAAFRLSLSQAGIADPLQLELYEEQGTRQLMEFASKFRGGQPVDVIATEKTFSINVAGATVVGRIDRIDRMEGNRTAIIDYKTGSPRDQKDADESLQLSIYALAAERALRLDPQRLVFYNLETNQAVDSARSADDLKTVEEIVREVADGIRSGQFDANPNFHCKTCTYREVCPATEERLYSIRTMGAGVQ